ncbi:MAG: bifunctional folylpolyglutamate synthase/dihydrofolate synthase [Acidobacteria bacterium]|nr:bifunctional folylpolyglutamate synthase/dihydrofolate synthase [Acidobacteriota bacterium]
MDYPQAVSYLYSLGNEVATAKLGLDNIRCLLSFLGDPQDRYPSVLIAGTNGKGSVAAFCESVLRTRGYRTGLYTSPHLVRIRERMRIGGREILPADLARLTVTVKEAVGQLLAGTVRNGRRLKLERHPTYFEMVTAMAFLYFAEKEVEIAILEVGLGGRLDATNVVDPIVSVITPVGYDHQASLGSDLKAIAREKAGIVKPRRPDGPEKERQLAVVCGSQEEGVLEVIREQCRTAGARRLPSLQQLECRSVRHRLEGSTLDLHPVLGTRLKLEVPLPGSHQVENALTAVRTLEVLHGSGFPLVPDAIERGIARTRWPGRLEVLPGRPRVVLDGAHNPAAAESLARHIRTFLPPEQVVLIYGSLRDKDIPGVFSLLSPLAREVILTRPDSERGAAPRDIVRNGWTGGRAVRCRTRLEEAWALARSLARPEDTLLVAGSLYLVGDLKGHPAGFVRTRPTPQAGGAGEALPCSDGKDQTPGLAAGNAGAPKGSDTILTTH